MKIPFKPGRDKKIPFELHNQKLREIGLDIPKEVPHGGQNIGFEHWRAAHSAHSDSKDFWIPQLPPTSSYSTRWADVVQNERFGFKGSRGRTFDIICDQTEIVNRKEKRRAERFFQGVAQRQDRRRREGTRDFPYDSRGSNHLFVRELCRTELDL